MELLDYVIKRYVALKESPDCLLRWLCPFAFAPSINENSYSSMAHQRLLLPNALHFSCSNTCEVESHYHFSLQCSDAS
jgi:hypothetical protein